MLRVHVKKWEDDCIEDVKGYFKIHKKRDWFNNPVVKRVILNIDKTIAVKDEYLESPIFGGMAPERLSTGCKAVILMEVLENPHIYGTRCGDNCWVDILEIATRKDVDVTLCHCPQLPEDGFELLMVDTGEVITNYDRFIDEFYRLAHEVEEEKLREDEEFERTHSD